MGEARFNVHDSASWIGGAGNGAADDEHGRAVQQRLSRSYDAFLIGNVGTGRRRDEQFATICGVARDQGKPVRIGVNGGSLNQELVVAKMQENTDRNLGHTSEEIINECMVLSAVQSTELALENGLRKAMSGLTTIEEVLRVTRED